MPASSVFNFKRRSNHMKTSIPSPSIHRVTFFFLFLALSLSLALEAGAQNQRGGNSKNSRPIEIKLIKNGRQNCYRCVQERGEYFVEIENVIDPRTKKTLEGTHDLSYKCKLGDIPIVKSLLFSNGRTERIKTECLIIITPKIIIQE